MKTVPSLRALALSSALLLTSAAPAFAQDSKALIDALIRKGVLTQSEADAITAEVVRTDGSMHVSTGGSKFIKRLALQGRFQAQFVSLADELAAGVAHPPATQHFMIRRVYFGAKADMGDGWGVNFNYDFANLSFDAAYITWKASDALVVDAGLRKVPFGYDETTSSGNLRAIERSPITRYFVESNNGRRLGAGSYHTGVFVGGTRSGWFYNLAATNPERDEFSTGDAVANATPGVAVAGGKTNNNAAWWGNVGYGGTLRGVTYKVGLEGGWVHDQGGKAVGTGDDLKVYSVFGDVTVGALNVQGAWLAADNQHGASATRGARPWGYWVMPSYRIAKWEGVVRYSFIDSDHRGVDLADGIRSAPAGGAMNKLSEWFVGGNYYFHANDTKLQLGYIFGKTSDTVTGAAATARTEGVRSQLQVNF